MRFMKPCVAVLVAAASLTVAGRAVLTGAPAPDTGLVVHEWGTFSTFSGSDGKNLRFEPYDNDLPEFVHGYLPRNSKVGPAGGTISLETPVVYFYTPRPLTASVEVRFPKGIITEWYPQADRSDHRIAWKAEVLAQENPRLPEQAGPTRYYAARETDAIPLRVGLPKEAGAGTEQEKFLFYRGVGTFDMPLSVRALGSDKFAVRWQADSSLGDLILVQVRNGKVRFEPFRLENRTAGAAIGEVQFPAEDVAWGDLGETLVRLLTAKGLFEKEARAMVKTWRSAWFGEEGTRVLYVLPEKLTEQLLPLKVEPRPRAVVRALVGRHDVLTPEREEQITAWVGQLKRPQGHTDAVGQAAAKQMQKLGRYHGAAWQAAEKRLKGESQKATPADRAGVR
jgi:hypothetical protein